MRVPRPRADADTLRAIKDLRRCDWKAERIARVLGVPLPTYYRWARYLDGLEARLSVSRRAGA